MNPAEAKILLRNLMNRIRQVDEERYKLSGLLTDGEFQALRSALAALSDGPPVAMPVEQELPVEPESEDESTEAIREPAFALNTSVFELPHPPADRRVCLDFGTAMSKAVLVRDESGDRLEEVEVLQLGRPGDQEEISETMLVSSVFIDPQGVLRFGESAVKHSRVDAQSGGHMRIDNIKRYLAEEGLHSRVPETFNPAATDITNRDMILAYLMFFTWAVSRCLEDIGEPRNVGRRFALPCLDENKTRIMAQTLESMIGEAQILADTFADKLPEGVALDEFMRAVRELHQTQLEFNFVQEHLTEPLGAAGSLMSWYEDVNALVMVIDVGAGTSDFSLYRMKFDAESGNSSSFEVAKSRKGITEAGNHLDKLLKGFILAEAGVDSNHEDWINIQSNLELDLRDYKERLFREKEIMVSLLNGEMVNVSLDEFLNLEQVIAFGESLKACRDDIMQSVDSSFINSAPFGQLAVALTGGGATLPMVQDLAEGRMSVSDSEIRLARTKNFPEWLERDFPDMEDDYPRIAVALGGARKQFIKSGGVAHVTGGDVSRQTLGGYYTRGG